MKRYASYVRTLSAMTNTSYAFISRIENDHAHIIAICKENVMLDNFSYQLEGSPCGAVSKNSFCVYTGDVQSQFPEASILVAMNVNRYMGCPIAIEGKAVAIMAIFGTGATFSDEKLCKDILMHIARNFSKELLEDRGGNIYIDYLLDKVQQLNPHQLEKVTKIIDQMLLKDVDLTTNDFHCSVKKHQ